MPKGGPKMRDTNVGDEMEGLGGENIPPDENKES